MDLDLDPWITQLKTVSALKAVEGAAELAAALKSRSVKTPRVFVLAVNETAGADRGGSGATIQHMRERIAIVIVVRNRKDSRGKAASDDLKVIRRAIKDKIIGWAPDASHDEVTFQRGALVDLTDATLWWKDEFETGYEERQL